MRGLTTGIDIGSREIRVIVALPGDKNSLPKVISIGHAPARGIRHGFVENRAEASAALRQAIMKAERNMKLRIRKCFLGISGVGLESITAAGIAMPSRADSIINELDVEKAHEAAEAAIPEAKLRNRRIIHSIPVSYTCDGQVVLGRPMGMKAEKLSVKMHFVTCLEQHIDELLGVAEDAGLEVTDVMASPIAGSLPVLSKAQKVAGSVVVNIGSDTTSLAVYENSVPLSVAVFPLGGEDITRDVALGLKLSLDDAEHVKVGSVTGLSFSRKKLDDIVHARLSDIFELIDKHLASLNRSGLLPAGAIFIGGGAKQNMIEELARQELKLPARLGSFTIPLNEKDSLSDNTLAIAYGLVMFGSGADGGGSIERKGALQDAVRAVLNWGKQFLP